MCQQQKPNASPSVLSLSQSDINTFWLPVSLLQPQHYCCNTACNPHMNPPRRVRRVSQLNTHKHAVSKQWLPHLWNGVLLLLTGWQMYGVRALGEKRRVVRVQMIGPPDSPGSLSLGYKSFTVVWAANLVKQLWWMMLGAACQNIFLYGYRNSFRGV